MKMTLERTSEALIKGLPVHQLKVGLGDDGDQARPIVPVTDAASPRTVLASESGTVFTNEGAAGTVLFTLPANASCEAGKTRFRFEVLAAQTIQVEPASGTIYGVSDYNQAGIAATNGSPVSSSPTEGTWIEVSYRGSNVWTSEMNGGWG